MDFLERVGEVPPFRRRICAFVDVKQPNTREKPVTLLNRHENPLDVVDCEAPRETVYVPISDKSIRVSLEMAVFPHPYTLIGLLENLRESPTNEEILASLLPLNLYVEELLSPTPNASEMLIPQIARLYYQDTDTFLRKFKRNVNRDLIFASWRAVFAQSQEKKEEIERQLQLFGTNILVRFPNVTFVLKTMDDLFSLHVLACAINTTMYLILPRSFAGTDHAQLLPPTVFCLPIGPKDAKYSLYVVVKSSEQFYIARPQIREKALRVRQPQELSNRLRTFETRNQKTAVYFVYKNEENKEFESIRTITTDEASISEAELHMQEEGNQLKIHLSRPSFNMGNNHLLAHLFDSISDDRSFVQSPRAEAPMTIMCQNVFAIVGEAPHNFVLTRVSRETKQSLEDFGKVRTEEALHRAVMASYKDLFYSGVQEDGDMMDIYAFRLLTSQLPANKRKDLGFEAPPSALPLFLSHVSRWTLAEFAQCPYAEFLCMQSIVRYAIGFTSRFCPFCGHDIALGKLMIPFHSRDELKWICARCIHKKEQRQSADWKANIHRIKQKFPMFIKIKEADDLKPLLKYYTDNIKVMRENRVGYMRDVVPLIDNAFSVFQKILYTHYRPVQYMKLRKEEEHSRAEYLHSMMGIKDNHEALVQIGYVTNYDCSEFPVDFAMFSKYLSMQSDSQHNTSQFRLIQSPGHILTELDLAAMERPTRKYQYRRINRDKFAIQAHPGRELNINFKFSGDNSQEITTEKYKYQLYPVSFPSRLAVSPIASISTELVIDKLWMLPGDRALIIAHQSQSHTRYFRTFIYLVHIGNVTLSAEEPLYTMTSKINLIDADFNEKYSALAISYETLKSTYYRIITILPKLVLGKEMEWKVPSLVYGPDDDLFLEQSENDAYYVFRWGVEEPIAEFAQEQKLVGCKGYLLAIDADGEVTTILDALADSDVERPPQKLTEFTGLKCPVFAGVMNRQQGLFLIPAPDLPFTGKEDRLSISFSKWQDSYEFAGTNGTGELRGMNFYNQLGMLPLPLEHPNRQLWNVNLTIAEFLPVLAAYEYNGTVYCVRDDMSHYYATKRHSFMPAAICSFYARTVNAISLHHIEDVITRHGLKVNIVGFMSLMDDDRVASLIDTIFGTRFLSVDIPGIWIGMRIIGDTAHVIIFFKDMVHHDKFQLMALYRGANVIELCTRKLIETLAFVHEWQTEGRRRNVLSMPDRYPKFQVSLFMPQGKMGINERAVFEYHSERQIASEVTKIPFRENWKTETIDDVREAADGENPESEFLENWDSILNLRLQEINSAYRAPYEPLLGVGVVKQIIGTYLTLLEFADVPPFTVLQYCTLKLKD